MLVGTGVFVGSGEGVDVLTDVGINEGSGVLAFFVTSDFFAASATDISSSCFCFAESAPGKAILSVFTAYTAPPAITATPATAATATATGNYFICGGA